MAKETRHNLRAEVREEYLKLVTDFLTNEIDVEVLRTKSNQICIPVVDRKGNEDYLTITFAIPLGGRDGTPFNGYDMRDEYNINQNKKKKEG